MYALAITSVGCFVVDLLPWWEKRVKGECSYKCIVCPYHNSHSMYIQLISAGYSNLDIKFLIETDGILRICLHE